MVWLFVSEEQNSDIVQNNGTINDTAINITTHGETSQGDQAEPCTPKPG